MSKKIVAKVEVIKKDDGAFTTRKTCMDENFEAVAHMLETRAAARLFNHYELADKCKATIVQDEYLLIVDYPDYSEVLFDIQQFLNDQRMTR